MLVESVKRKTLVFPYDVAHLCSSFSVFTQIGDQMWIFFILFSKSSSEMSVFEAELFDVCKLGILVNCDYAKGKLESLEPFTCSSARVM